MFRKGAPSPDELRRERIEAARRRAVEAENQAVYEEILLQLEEDTDYFREQTKQTREARRQRRQRPKQ